MTSASETKKLILGEASKMSKLGKALETSKEQFESARVRAENVVRGSASDVEANLVGKLNQASEYAEAARLAVEKAMEACTAYAETKI